MPYVPTLDDEIPDALSQKVDVPLRILRTALGRPEDSFSPVGIVASAADEHYSTTPRPHGESSSGRNVQRQRVDSSLPPLTEPGSGTVDEASKLDNSGR